MRIWLDCLRSINDSIFPSMYAPWTWRITSLLVYFVIRTNPLQIHFYHSSQTGRYPWPPPTDFWYISIPWVCLSRTRVLESLVHGIRSLCNFALPLWSDIDEASPQSIDWGTPIKRIECNDWVADREHTWLLKVSVEFLANITSTFLR